MNIKTAAQQAVLRACSRKNVIFLSHSLVIDNKRGARNEQNANRRSCGRDSFNRFKRSGTNRTGRLSATASAHDEPPYILILQWMVALLLWNIVCC